MVPAGRPRKGPRIHFQFADDEQQAAVKAAADDEGLTVTEMLRRMIDEGLERRGKMKP